MESKVSYTLVGLFVIVLGTALLGAALWLLLGGETKRYDRYRVYTSESVSGLNLKAKVTYRGVEVGRVASVQLNRDNPEQVEIILEIEEGTPIREDTEAILVSQGITGLTTMELTGGTRDAPALEAAAGGALPVIANGPSLVARLDSAFTNMAAQFDSLAIRLETLLGDENQLSLNQTLANLNTITGAVSTLLNSDNQLAFSQALVNVKTLTDAVAGRADKLGQGLDSLALTFDNSARISMEMTPLIGRFNESLLKAGETALSITKTSESLGKAVQESRRDLLKIANDTAPEIASLVAELRQFTAGLQRLGRELERDPRSLLFGKRRGQAGPGE